MSFNISTSPNTWVENTTKHTQIKIAGFEHDDNRSRNKNAGTETDTQDTCIDKRKVRPSEKDDVHTNKVVIIIDTNGVCNNTSYKINDAFENELGSENKVENQRSSEIPAEQKLNMSIGNPFSQTIPKYEVCNDDLYQDIDDVLIDQHTYNENRETLLNGHYHSIDINTTDNDPKYQNLEIPHGKNEPNDYMMLVRGSFGSGGVYCDLEESTSVEHCTHL